jgi:diaminopimelate decarboxylase
MRSQRLEKELIDAETLRTVAAVVGDNVTPFYVVNIDRAKARAAEIKRGWAKHFSQFAMAYSYKSNSLLAIVSELRPYFDFADVSSAAELHFAVDDGYAPGRILVGGPAKTEEMIYHALKAQCTLKCDSLQEATTIVAASERLKIAPRRCLLRVATRRGGRWSRFGLIPTEIIPVWQLLHKRVEEPIGLHFHLGSYISDIDAHGGVTRMYASILKILASTARRDTVMLDVGGGYMSTCGLSGYPSAADYAVAVKEATVESDIDSSRLELVIEPGRSVLELAGVLVTRVIAVKRRGRRVVLVVDGNTQLVRSASGATRTVSFLRSSSHKKVNYDIVGNLCFEGDVIAKAIPGPEGVERGEVVVVGQAGAYDMAATTIWTHPSIGVIGIVDGRAHTLRSAQGVHEMSRGRVS